MNTQKEINIRKFLGVFTLYALCSLFLFVATSGGVLAIIELLFIGLYYLCCIVCLMMANAKIFDYAPAKVAYRPIFLLIVLLSQVISLALNIDSTPTLFNLVDIGSSQHVTCHFFDRAISKSCSVAIPELFQLALLTYCCLVIIFLLDTYSCPSR